MLRTQLGYVERNVIAILIPAYNEKTSIDSTLRAVESVFAQHLPSEKLAFVLVDDGSQPPLSFPERAGVHRLRHLINLGQGAAIQTAITYARDRLRADAFVTMDSDGQHDPSDLPALLDPVLEGSTDIAFGNRFGALSAEGIPATRKTLLKAATAFERLLTGLRLNDAHNGYRAFNRKAAQALEIQQNRMAHATEIKQKVARHRLRYAEVPVRIRYTDETLAKGQRNLGSLVILKDLLNAYLIER